MNTNEQLKATGRLDIKVFGPDGNIKEEQAVTNLVVTTGLGFIASRMKDTTSAAMSHMAVGSGTASAAAGNTALVTELGRVALSSTTVTNNTIAYAASFGPGVGTGAVSEAGIFNAGSSGTMLCRTAFAVVNKDVNDTLAISWTVTIGAA